MDSNLNYQQARRLRKTGFFGVLADQMLYEPTVGGAIKRAASLKLQSKVKGITEKFDPLNIARMLTFGSKLGPSLLGKMSGRSKQDIEYFTGRLKPIAVRQGSKVTPLPKDGEQLVEGKNIRIGGTNGLNEQLLKIYKFLKKSKESDKKRRELSQNFDEERMQEADRRHQELLKKLEKLRNDIQGLSSPTATAQAEEESGTGIFETIFDNIWPKVLEKVPLLGWLGAYVAIPALAGALFHEYWEDRKNRVSQENIEEAKQRGGDVSGQAAAELERMRQTGEDQDPMNDDKVKMLMEQRDDGAKRRDYFREEFLRSNGYRKTTGLFSNVPVYKDNAKKEPPADMMKVANQFAEEQTQKIFTGEVKDPLGKFTYKSATKTSSTETKNVTPDTAAATTGAGGGRGGQGGPTAVQAAQNTGLNTATITPSAAGNEGKLNAVMAENVDATLPKQKAEANVVVNNTISKAKKNSQPLDKLSELSVRNDEPTLLRMVMDSIRVI